MDLDITKLTEPSVNALPNNYYIANILSDRIGIIKPSITSAELHKMKLDQPEFVKSLIDDGYCTALKKINLNDSSLS